MHFRGAVRGRPQEAVLDQWCVAERYVDHVGARVVLGGAGARGGDALARADQGEHLLPGRRRGTARNEAPLGRAMRVVVVEEVLGLARDGDQWRFREVLE